MSSPVDFRTFEGSTPVMLVYDAEWIKEAFVKNFSFFTNRRRLLFGGALDQGLFSMEGDHWRHSRKMLSSEFSSGKLKKVRWVTASSDLDSNCVP